MGDLKGMTQKINSALDQSSTLIKFLLQVIAAVGVMSGIILYPILSRVNIIERSIDDLKIKIETKVDEKTYQSSLTDIKKTLDDMKTDIKWLVRGR